MNMSDTQLPKKIRELKAREKQQWGVLVNTKEDLTSDSPRWLLDAGNLEAEELW